MTAISIVTGTMAGATSSAAGGALRTDDSRASIVVILQQHAGLICDPEPLLWCFAFAGQQQLLRTSPS